MDCDVVQVTRVDDVLQVASRSGEAIGVPANDRVDLAVPDEAPQGVVTRARLTRECGDVVVFEHRDDAPAVLLRQGLAVLDLAFHAKSSTNAVGGDAGVDR